MWTKATVMVRPDKVKVRHGGKIVAELALREGPESQVTGREKRYRFTGEDADGMAQVLVAVTTDCGCKR